MSWQAEDAEANYWEACRAIRNTGARMDRIYFCDSDDVVKIGFSSNGKRVAAHERTGLVLRAILPGSYQDEQALHRHFQHLHKGDGWGKEYYEPAEEIYEYIDGLLAQNLATPFENEIDTLPQVPFSMWRPGSPAVARSMDQNAQLLLWNGRTAKERVEFHSTFAHCQSLTDEWYTPPEWITLARDVMGSIDVDPATTAVVNRLYIKAPVYYTKSLNGLAPDAPWEGNIWLNPPYGRGENSASSFLHRLVRELEVGTVKQAIACLNLNSMSSVWFHETVIRAKAIHCIPATRVAYIAPDPEMKDSSPNKGTVFCYFGAGKDRFAEVFGMRGEILKSYAG